MNILDGTGTGYVAKVDKNNNLRTFSITKTQPVWTNETFGLSYTMLAFITPEVQNPSISGLSSTCFAYMKNTSDNNMILTDIRMWVENSAEGFDMYLNHSGAPVGGTKTAPINMNLGSGKTASGTFLIGTDITGLSGGMLFDRLRIPADDDDHPTIWTSNLILPKNNIITLHAMTGGQEVEASISFHYIH